MGKNKSQIRLVSWDAETTRQGRRAKKIETAKEAARLRKEWKAGGGADTGTGLPKRSFGVGGEARPRNLRGTGMVSRPETREASTFTLAGAFPWVSQSGLGTVRAYIGNIVDGGGMWCLDPWEAYGRDLISGMSCVLIGTVGTGKSTTVKAWTKRLVQAGRQAIIMSDAKGEWGIVARALAPQGKDPEITVGVPGKVLNPLDSGRRPSSRLDTDGREVPISDEEWVRMVRSRRSTMMKTIAQILSGRQLDGDEKLALSRAIEAGAEACGEDVATMTPETTIPEAAAMAPTIPDVIVALRNPSQETEDFTAGAGRGVANTLTELVEGDLKGLFDGRSTVSFDEALPMLVFNTRPLRNLSPQARKIASHCVSSWAESVFTNRDSGQRVAVYEEGWENLDDVASLERMVAQWKLARDYGLFNILVLHKLSDLNRAGDEGSRARELAVSLLADTDIRVVHRQKSDQLRATAELLRLTASEREEIARAPKGVALWKVGELEGRMVKTVRTRLEGELFDTDHAMVS